MLLVETKIGASKIHGIGLFADESIPEGTLIWRFYPNFDLKFSKNAFNALPTPAKNTILRYAYLSLKTNQYILSADNDRFCNHSETPNLNERYTSDDEENCTIATRDIQKGEELTYDYRAFDADFDYKVGRR